MQCRQRSAHSTVNSWFAAWAGLLSSINWCIGLQNSFYSEQSRNIKYIFNLVLCSIVLLIASIAPLTQKWRNYGAAGFSVSSVDREVRLRVLFASAHLSYNTR